MQSKCLLWSIAPILMIFHINVMAQKSISGIVRDKATGLPIPDVYAYLDGTSFVTITNDSGAFYLNAGKIINAKLIFYHMMYEKITIDQPFEKKSIEVDLIEKNIELGEVVIKTGPFARKEKLKAFEKQFLGDNKAGKSCKILNKDDLYLFFDEEEKTLNAKCVEPLIVQNEFLGYKMHFTLTDFNIRYLTKSIKDGQIEYSLMRGSVFFEDIAPNNPVINKRRIDAYKGSLVCFFKNLANNTLEKSGHIIYNHRNNYQIHEIQQANPASFFFVTEKGADKNLIIKSNSGINTLTYNTYKFPLPIYGVITVVDPTKGLSEIIFLTNEFIVDPFGLIDKRDYIYVSGSMSNQRVGNMVPLDFEF